MYRYLILFIMSITLFGCVTDDVEVPAPPIQIGLSPSELSDVADVQRDSTAIINTEATSILKSTKDAPTIASTTSILVENATLTSIVDTIESESEHKDELLTENKELRDIITQLEKTIDTNKLDYEAKITKLSTKEERGFRRFMLFLRIIGALAIPIGLFLGLKLSRVFLWLIPGGVTLIVLSNLIEILNKYSTHIVIAIGVVVGAVLFKQYRDQAQISKDAVIAAEITKSSLKRVAPDEAKRIYGDSVDQRGILKQNNMSKRAISSIRKKFIAETDSFYKEASIIPVVKKTS